MQSNVTEPPKTWDKGSRTVLTDSSEATFMEKHKIFNHFFFFPPQPNHKDKPWLEFYPQPKLCIVFLTAPTPEIYEGLTQNSCFPLFQPKV